MDRLNTTNVGIGLLGLGVLALGVLNIIGLVFLTKLTWQSPDKDGKVCIKATKTQANLMKLFLVMTWLPILISIIVAVGGYYKSRQE